MTTRESVEHTFRNPSLSLKVFIQMAIPGASHPDRETMISRVNRCGPKAALELLDYLKTGLPSRAGHSMEEFVVGHEAETDDRSRRLVAYEALMFEVFGWLWDFNRRHQDPSKQYEFGERLIGLVRKVADQADPLLTAWGV